MQRIRGMFYLGLHLLAHRTSPVHQAPPALHYTIVEPGNETHPEDLPPTTQDSTQQVDDEDLSSDTLTPDFHDPIPPECTAEECEEEEPDEENVEEIVTGIPSIPDMAILTSIQRDHPIENVIGPVNVGVLTRSQTVAVEHQIVIRLGSSGVDPMNSEENRAAGAVGFEFDPLMVSDGSHMVRGGQLVQGVPAGGYSWNRAHGVPYLQDSAFHGYQVAAMGRNSAAGMHPHQVSYNVYHPPPPSPQMLPPPPPPMLPIQAQNLDIQLQQPSTSHRHSTRPSHMYPFQSDAPVPRFVGPALPHGAMVYEARRQQFMINSISRRRSFSHHRVTLEEAVQALREQLGQAVDSGLPAKFIAEHLKTRTFTSSRHHSQDLTPADEEPNLCVICQMELEDQEKVGTLGCSHEYHAKCIKKWLTVKNNCPVCKSTALR
ncbi:hypothetical protein M8C21_030421 [Ambrosia artemisiifolia]|uniref:RING-type E3 ubiquitin transferase n=1 Tax=Ambrosia artemisiifolia TaxID=4212 RepID=A0AAD5D2R1_AMBAR|nr:hypothetical protein M8C21_030421 [Ambrosia artemisiifolia]